LKLVLSAVAPKEHVKSCLSEWKLPVHASYWCS